MTEAQFEIELAGLQTKISRCMDKMGRHSDATSRAGRQAYFEAQNELWRLQDKLNKLLNLHHGDEE